MNDSLEQGVRRLDTERRALNSLDNTKSDYANSFKALLWRLHPDQAKQEEAYKSLRYRLVKLFERRCVRYPDLFADPDLLADETVDRVVKNIGKGVKIQNITHFFSGVARNVYREWIRRELTYSRLRNEYPNRPPAIRDTSNDDQIRCMKKCLQELPGESRETIVEYYMSEGRDGANHRDAMAARMGITQNALRLRITRLRRELRECRYRCLVGINSGARLDQASSD